MKRFELLFAFLQLPLDYALLVGAGLTAYLLRNTPLVASIRPVLFHIPFEQYFGLVVVVAAGWIILFALAGLYHTNPNRKLALDLSRVMFACSAGFAAITVYVFFTLQKFDSRFLVLVGYACALLYVTLGRIAMYGLKALLHRAQVGLRRMVIIGQEQVAVAIEQALRSHPALGYNVVDVFPHFSNTLNQLTKLELDEIIFTDPKAHIDETLAAVAFANDHHITFKYSADLFSTIATHMTVSTIAGIPIIEIQRTRLSGWGAILKRLVDLVGATLLCIIFAPIMILLAVAILIETGRPIIYLNERIGKTGKKFTAYKFRSMYQKFCTGAQFGASGEAALATEQQLITTHNSKTGPVYKIKNDPRVTKVGQFIRRWSLDELPQFWNVLLGNMSLVGPRPHQPREVINYERHHTIVLAIKPGITGLAQISGRSDLTFDEEIRLDTFYIEHWSLYIDAIILLKTPFIVFKRKGAW